MDGTTAATFAVAITTLILSGVSAYSIVNSNRDRRLQWEHEGEDALKALAEECRINLTIIEDESGYGRAARLRDSALQRAMPYFSRLNGDVQKAARQIPASIALISRMEVLSAESASVPAPFAAGLMISRLDAFRKHVEGLTEALTTTAEGIDNR